MQSWMQRWWPSALGSAPLGWGLAPLGRAWALVGLSGPDPHGARVHSSAWLQAPEAAQDAQSPFSMAAPFEAQDPRALDWLSRDLHQHGLQRWRWRQRLNVALPPSHLREGFLDFPANLPQSDWVYEVMLQASQALQLPTEAVSFDFEPDPVSDGLAQRVFWMACARSHTTTLKNCTRAAGWRLAAVESQAQAMARGLGYLQGGAASVLTQAPTDWLFHLPHAPAEMRSETDGLSFESSPVEREQEMAQVMAQLRDTPTGSWLAACGLALRAWL